MAEPAATAADWAEVRRVALGAQSSFLWGMRVLPGDRRRAMYALYAFCRAVDDIADAPGSAEGRRQGLLAWRVEVDRLYRGAPRWPIARALAGPIERYRLPRAEFDAVLDGMMTDAHPDVRIADWPALDLYCRRVAGAVGLLSVRIFGAEGEAADQIALKLGRALQLTNILRDLREDAAIGRMYVPGTVLSRQGVAAADPMAVLADPGFPAAAAEVAAETRRGFAEVDALLTRADRRRLKPSIVMMEVYRRLLDRLENTGFRSPDRVSLPTPLKLWLALRHGLL